MGFQNHYTKLRDLVKVLEDLDSEREVSAFGFRDVHTFSWFWCIDRETEEYLIKFPSRGREESMHSHYYFFFQGFVFKLSCINYTKGEVTFHNFPAELEHCRSKVQDRVAEALLVYGYFGDGKSPIIANFIKDNVGPPCI